MEQGRIPELDPLAVLADTQTATSHTAAWSAFRRRLNAAGFSGSFYSFGVPRNATHAFEHVHRRKSQFGVVVSRDWMRFMLRRREISRHSPIIRHCRASVTPINWTDPMAVAGLTPLEQRSYRAVRDHGMRGGVSFPLHEAGGRHYGQFGLTTCDPPREFEAAVRAQQSAVHLAAIYFHGSLQARGLLPDDGAEVRLSRRERECLLRVAHGLTTMQIADELSLSDRTVDFYLGNAARKLGARTRAEAVAKAMTAGLITP